ncbi:unnamed protein product, partial [marine sediment metagenome]
TIFTFAWTFLSNTLRVWINGLEQEEGESYTWNPDTQELKFFGAPVSSDKIRARGLVSSD